jgi:hypothetical protein|tara:strand:- start:377 stop:1240 length:864 start_codon:yes stop_codon:yes gene_type:complete
MIKSSNDIWREIAEVNNLKWEFKLLGKDQDIPVIVANDYWKFPDQIADFLRTGHWWTNGFNDLDGIIRPGKSLYIHEEILDWFAEPIAKSLRPIFGVNKMGINSVNGNCFNGNMELDSVYSAMPHTDVVGDMNVVTDQAHVALNINLTKDSDPVATGFYSYNGKKSRLHFNHMDTIDENQFLESLDKSMSYDAKWFQIENYGPYALEDSYEMMYNSIVCYPTHFLHSPYIKKEWFLNSDRITLAAFLNTQPKDLDFVEANIENISYAWEFFNLDKIHNFHPKKTKPL